MNSFSRRTDLAGRSTALAVASHRALWACFWLLSAISVAVVVGMLTDDDNRPVVVVLLVLAAIAIVFELSLVRNGAAPFFEIGGFFAAVVSIYACYPMIGYLVNGLTFTPLNDLRLFNGQPTPRQIATIGWWYAAFLASFCLAYRLCRGRNASLRARPASIRLLVVAVVLYGVILAFIMACEEWLTLNEGTYEGTYVAIRNLPRLLRQVYTSSAGMLPTLSILILIGFFAHYSKTRVYILLWFATFGYLVWAARGSRTGFFILAFAALMLYHHLVRPISLRSAVVMAVVGVIAFNAFGALRASHGLSAGMFGVANEFESIFATVFDLKYVQQAQGALLGHPELRLTDLLAVIPQQLLPFPKGMPADWYVITYYPTYYATGGGMAFGVVAEAVTGWGWVELAIRGVLLGVLFGLLHRHFSRRVLGPGTLALYIWLTMWSYNCVRNTTMPLLGWFIYQFLVPIGIVMLLTRLVSRRGVRGATVMIGA